MSRREKTEALNELDNKERKEFLQSLTEAERKKFINEIRTQAVINFWNHEHDFIR